MPAHRKAYQELRHMGGGVRWYSPALTGPLGTATPTQDKLYAEPFYAPPGTLYGYMAVTVVSAEPSANVRFGIYTDNNGRPDALIVDTGVVDVSPGGSIYIGDINPPNLNRTLSGWYWLAIVQQGGSPPTMIMTESFVGRGGTTSPYSVGSVAAYGQTGVSGDLPSPWGGTYAEQYQAPIIYILAA